MSIEELYNVFAAHPQITTDSRECPEGSIFFALKGDSFDGNKFASSALEKGCAYAVVDDVSCITPADERFIVVEDVLATLQALAQRHRENFAGPVIQITGTNGKTTTKELVSTVLAQRYCVLYTQGNLNNHIGVPKTLLRLGREHDIAVIETGANHPGEIAALADIVEPDCGLITNVGIAHIEGFGSFEGVVKTKGELYDYLRNPREFHRREEKGEDAFIFLNADNPHLATIAEGLRAVTYGSIGHGYDVEGEVVECAPFLRLRWREGHERCEWHEVQTRLIGAYNIDNVLAAVSVGLHYGVDAAQIDKALEAYAPTNSRSEMRRTERNCLIVDAYNANPSSMKAALQNFGQIAAPDGLRKMVILGDMRELGAVSEREHRAVVDMLRGLDVDDVWLVGDNFQSVAPPFPVFRTVEDVKHKLQDSPVEGRIILIKGSNGTRLYELPSCL